MTAALIVFAAFAGIAVVVATFAATVLLASGKLTLPNTNARREMRARTETAVAQQGLLQERFLAERDDLIQSRFTKALAERSTT